MMAVALIVAWTRGVFIGDTIHVRIGSRTELAFRFEYTAINVECRWEIGNKGPPVGFMRAGRFFDRTTPGLRDLSSNRQVLFPMIYDAVWRKGMVDEGRGVGTEFPYGTSIIFLTLVSAYLVLWKPRKSVR